jgi:hypothetical protein
MKAEYLGYIAALCLTWMIIYANYVDFKRRRTMTPEERKREDEELDRDW